MLALCLALLTASSPSSLRFVNAKTNESRSFEAPSSTIIKSTEVTESEKGWQFDLVLQGSFDPTSREPQILEIFRFSDTNTLDVLLLQIQGTSSIEPVKELKRGEAVLLCKSGQITTITPSIRKDGITVVLPKLEGMKNWCAVTRWRPANLPDSFSPSSIWNSPVSTVFGRRAKMQSVPSLPGFLKFEFGK